VAASHVVCWPTPQCRPAKRLHLLHALRLVKDAVAYFVHSPVSLCLQDVVIVGCACTGLMGVGADSQPVEVDPLAVHARGRRAAAARKRQGKPALPTKGVSVLLGKLPPGCAARAFAQEVSQKHPARTSQWSAVHWHAQTLCTGKHMAMRVVKLFLPLSGVALAKMVGLCWSGNTASTYGIQVQIALEKRLMFNHNIHHPNIVITAAIW